MLRSSKLLSARGTGEEKEHLFMIKRAEDQEEKHRRGHACSPRGDGRRRGGEAGKCRGSESQSSLWPCPVSLSLSKKRGATGEDERRVGNKSHKGRHKNRCFSCTFCAVSVTRRGLIWPKITTGTVYLSHVSENQNEIKRNMLGFSVFWQKWSCFALNLGEKSSGFTGTSYIFPFRDLPLT